MADATDTLNTLITTCHDGKTGYDYAAERADNPTLKATLQQYATQRAGFAQELSTHVTTLGGSPSTSGSVAGSLHQSWLGLKDMATGSGDKAILGECVRGEEHAVSAYEDATKSGNLSPETVTVVTKQHTAVTEALANLKQLHSTAT
jgi:uncharacterized protein (TIGR02284 family)